MGGLRPIEIKLIDELTGMSSGYVLDFTNATFAEFFKREVGVNIYDNAYAIFGTSKGKRLRAFLQIAQTAAIRKALSALWEYREMERISRGKEENVHGAYKKMSAILERLGGAPLPSENLDPMPSASSKPAAVALEKLAEEFLSLHSLGAQARGYAFEKFLTSFFDAWEMEARSGFRVVGEQIDGSFQHEGSTYLVEAKWHREPTDAATLHSFQGKVEERPQWTRGLFVSYQGFTDQALHSFTARRIILMDGMDIVDALHRNISLKEVIKAKARHASERKSAFGRVRLLFTEMSSSAIK